LIDSLHFGVPELTGIAQVVDHHVECIVSPENFTVDYKSRHAEHALRYSPFGVIAESLLDDGLLEALCDRLCRVLRKIGNDACIGDIAPVHEHSIEYRSTDRRSRPPRRLIAAPPVD